MAATKKQHRLHAKACRLLGLDPNAIRLVGPNEWQGATGRGVGCYWGRANTGSYRLDPAQGRMVYVARGAGLSTNVHELLHHLFLSWPHIRIRQAAAYLVGQGNYTRVFGSKAKLLQRVKRQAQRYGLEETSP